MIIDGFEKLTLLDYPEHMACIIFTRGCNFACPYCQNSTLIPFSESENQYQEEEILKFLEKRKGMLDGIVITGGEPTLQKGLEAFIQKVKKLGMLVKLDTNGSNPEVLTHLINEKLLDYIAMDVKMPLEKYEKMTKNKKLDSTNIQKSLHLIQTSGIEHEFRTTLVKEFIELDDLQNILKEIGPHSNYYLQNFKDSEHVLQKNLHGYHEEEIINMVNQLKKDYPKIKYRN